MRGHGEKILLVEDEWISAEYLKALYKVVDIVDNGREAIMRADQLKPDLILLGRE